MEFYHDKKLIAPLKIPILQKILLTSTLSNKGSLLTKNGNYEIIGDPTEVSLLVLSKKAGLDKKDFKTKIIDDLAFSSELKFRATLVENNKKEIFSVGAFEKILNKKAKFVKIGVKLLIK